MTQQVMDLTGITNTTSNSQFNATNNKSNGKSPSRWVAGIFLSLLFLHPLTADSLDQALKAGGSNEVDALAMMFQVVTQFKDAVNKGDLDPVHNEDAFIGAAVNELFYDATNIAPNRVDAFRADLTALARQSGDLHAAADAGRQAQAEAELKKVEKAFKKVFSCFPNRAVAAAREKADVYTCPMHREVRGKRNDPCPKCGMAMEQMVRILPTTCTVDTAGQAIHASLRTDGVLIVGKPVTCYLHLTKADGFPVCLTDLIETHTKKIHLLIIDHSLTDYHHEHPKPTDKLGEYVFSFTPQRPGSYRVWADLRPYPLGLQEYVIADLPASTPDPPLTDRTLTNKVSVDGLNYELFLDRLVIRVGTPLHARLRITSPDGNGFDQLQPIMATFAHIVGFNEDHETVMHIHPMGPPVLDPNARGGPELDFQIYGIKPGFVRLFAQVQIGGASRFAPFGIRVEP
jgi:hypothetical protein